MCALLSGLYIGGGHDWRGGGGGGLAKEGKNVSLRADKTFSTFSFGDRDMFQWLNKGSVFKFWYGFIWFNLKDSRETVI